MFAICLHPHLLVKTILIVGEKAMLAIGLHLSPYTYKSDKRISF